MKTTLWNVLALALMTVSANTAFAADETLEAWQTDYTAFVATLGRSLATNAFILEGIGFMMGNQQPHWGLCSSDQQKAYDAADAILSGKKVSWRGVVRKVASSAEGPSVVLELKQEKQVSGKWDFPRSAILKTDSDNRPFPVADWNDPPGVWVMVPPSSGDAFSRMQEGQEVNFCGTIGKSKLPDSGIILIAGYGGSFSGRHCVSLFLDAAEISAVKDGPKAGSKETSPSAETHPPVAKSPDGTWPKYADELRGENPVRVKNPNEFDVKVGLRSGTGGKDFTVSSGATATVNVPDGAYEIFFRYSSDPDGIYKGDDFRLNGNGVEIQIVKVVNGNYGIRKVR